VSFGYIFFGEKLNYKMMIGIIVTIIGIMWISLAKGAQSPDNLKETSSMTKDDASYYKTLSIILALGVGCMNASFTV
jgi:drug/metabolite transporter (DMT)-like permease